MVKTIKQNVLGGFDMRKKQIFKKLLSFALTLAIIVCAIPLGTFTFTASAATSGYYTYTVSNGEATITDVKTSISGNVTIPSTLGGYLVTKIDDMAFALCECSSITIPDSVTSIGDEAFYICDSLTSVTIGNGVTNIGESVFYKCNSLAEIYVKTNNKNYSSQNGVLFNKDKTTLVMFPFGKKEKSYTIPTSVETIGEKAFYDCDNLTSVTISDSVTIIEKYAFHHCDSLTSVTIGNGVTSIGYNAFYNSSSLTSVYITDIVDWCNIEFNTAYANPIYSAKNLYLNGTLVTDLVIPDGVTSIGSFAFFNCESLTSVTIPDSVTNIGISTFLGCTNLTSLKIGDNVTSICDYAFYNCQSLTSITIPSSVTSIGNDAFAYCDKLTTVNYNAENCEMYTYNSDTGYYSVFRNCPITTVNIGNNVKKIPSYAFYGCDSLTSVTIPDSVTSIGRYAFYNCTSITSIIIPEGITYIYEYTFYNCTNLKNAIIPDGVTSIGYYAFYGCDSLTSITIPDNVTYIAQYAFVSCDSLAEINVKTNNTNFSSQDGVLFNKDKTTLIAFPAGKKEDLYTIPTSVTTIGEYAFIYCNSLTSVVIPNSLDNIDDHAFDNCKSLKSITISNSITSIGRYAFYNCDSLTSVTIPDSVTCIESNAFYDCGKLTSVTIGNGVTSIGDSAFDYCYSLTKVYITDVAAWCEIDFYNNYSNPLYYAKKIYLNGEIVTDIIIPDGVASICDYAFYNCESLTSVTIPDSVISIGDSAFNYCSKLKNVYYRGSEQQKSSITIGYSNSKLTSATWYYDTCIGTELHTYNLCDDTTCNVCGYEREITHAYSSDCDTQCNVCGFERVSSESHTYDNNCDATCNKCNIIRENIIHTYDSSCDAICNICDFKRVTSESHAYDNNCDTTCNRCSTTRDDITHTYNNDCDTECNVCGYTRTVSDYVHIYDNACDSDCNVCNHTRTVLDSVHIYDNACDTGCNICGFTRATDDHVFSDEFDKYCDECNKERYIIAFDANGGTSAPTTQYKFAGETLVLNSSQPRRDSYVFAGWGTTQKCGKQYLPGDEYTIDEDITFLALWYDFENCTTCNGSGISTQSCSNCSGLGYYYKRTCSSCGSTSLCEIMTGLGSAGFKCNNCSSSSNTNVRYNCGYCGGDGRYNGTCKVCYGEGGETLKLSAPKILSFNDTTVTLFALDGYEYSCDGVFWQESNVFTNLSPGTKYTFYMRVSATDTTPFSAISSGVSITTDKSKQILVPSVPKVQSVTSSSITLVAVDGCEYSKDGTTWQSSNVFEGLSCGTEYTFYQRYKETTTTYAGNSSAAVVIKTDKGTQTKPSAPTLLSKTHNSITLTAISGYEYSLDAVNWQTSNVFTGLNPQTNYSFFQRKAENDKYYASATSDQVFISTSNAPECYYNPQLHVYDDKYDADCNECGDIRDVPQRDWKVSVTQTGIYNITPSKTLSGFNKESITVLDDNGSVVKYNDSKNGWPLVAGQEYTIKFNKEFDYSGELTWKTTKKADTIFPDTDKNGWYNDAVTYAVGAGIMSGYSNGKFGTSDSIQRQDFLVMLARYEGVDLSEYNYKSKFSDVARGSYYEAAVNWGAEKGIVTGYNNGKFGVGDKVTREQLVTFLYRYAKYKGIDTTCTAAEKNYVKNTYSDYKNVSSFAQDAIVWAVTYGVIGGKTPTTIVPQGNAQRCEVAKIMYNIYLNDIFK